MVVGGDTVDLQEEGAIQTMQYLTKDFRWKE